MYVLSVFADREVEPDKNDLAGKIGLLYATWQQVTQLVLSKLPHAIGQWNYPGQKYGWSYRLKYKRRAILYLLPQDACFDVVFVFGNKADKAVLESNCSDAIKDELMQAHQYAEGRSIRLNIDDNSLLDDLETLIDIKIRFK